MNYFLSYYISTQNVSHALVAIRYGDDIYKERLSEHINNKIESQYYIDISNKLARFLIDENKIQMRKSLHGYEYSFGWAEKWYRRV